MKPFVKMPFPGPKARALFERDQKVSSTSNTRGYPILADYGQGVFVWDVDGNCFLDLMAGIAVNTTGYAHPRIVEAVKQQTEKLVHLCYAIFPQEPQIRLAERLNEKLGGGYRVFFGNSGTEGMEAVMKLVRYHSKRPYSIAFTGGFHGRSSFGLSLTASNAKYKKGFGPLIAGVTHIPFPNPYRPIFGATAETVGDAVQDYLEHLFKTTLPPEEVGAVYIEPIQGEGGYIVPPKGFLPALRKLTEKHGILLVADEVQTGVGRTGKFFAMEHEGVKPDVVVLAKGLASGFPISAVLFKEELSTWEPGSHGTTFGGNTVAAAAAHATLDLLEEGVMQNAADIGSYFIERLKQLQKRFPRIGEVRGRGLMVGLEAVKDPITKEEDPALRDALVKRCYQKGLMVLGAGTSAMRLAPPLIISKEEADLAIELVGEALADVLEQPKAQS